MNLLKELLKLVLATGMLSAKWVSATGMQHNAGKPKKKNKK
jgi:hypothetical protein